MFGGSRDSVSGGMEIAARHQRAGHMWKLPMSKPNSEKWQRRFFVAKDGFLLYYASGKVDQAFFDTKPKGCIPLGGCKVDFVDRGPKGARFGLKITHPDFFSGKLLVLAAESEAEQKAWLEALSDCSRVTMHNAKVGEAMIEKLRAQGTAAEKEKQDALDKLIAEQEEKSRLAAEGESLKSKVIEATELAAKREAEMATLVTELEGRRQEVEAQAAEINASLAEKAAALAASNAEYERLQEALSTARAASEAAASSAAPEDSASATASRATSLPRSVSSGASALSASALSELELRARAVEDEKLRLEREKIALERTVRDLTSSTMALQSRAESAEDAKRRMEAQMANIQNEEGDLHNERQLRKRLERKLQIAEDSLKRLDVALRRSGVKLDVDVFADVNTLRAFFEERVEENRRDAQRIGIMKKALKAKRRYLVASARADNFDTSVVLPEAEGDDEDDTWDLEGSASAGASGGGGAAGGAGARSSVAAPSRAVRRSMSMKKAELIPGVSSISSGPSSPEPAPAPAPAPVAAVGGAGASASSADDTWGDDDDSVAPDHSDDEADDAPAPAPAPVSSGVVKAALVGVTAGMHHDHLGPLPDGWTVQVDEEGDIWYFNEMTEATSWYRPNTDGSIPAAPPS